MTTIRLQRIPMTPANPVTATAVKRATTAQWLWYGSIWGRGVRGKTVTGPTTVALRAAFCERIAAHHKVAPRAVVHQQRAAELVDVRYGVLAARLRVLVDHANAVGEKPPAARRETGRSARLGAASC